MYTVKQVYEPIVTLKKKNGLCQIMKMDCSTGAIEVYASGLQDEEAMRRIEEDELVMIPQHLFMEEADRVQKYLSRE